jgi:hypothetical protein
VTDDWFGFAINLGWDFKRCGDFAVARQSSFVVPGLRVALVSVSRECDYPFQVKLDPKSAADGLVLDVIVMPNISSTRA